MLCHVPIYCVCLPCQSFSKFIDLWFQILYFILEKRVVVLVLAMIRNCLHGVIFYMATFIYFSTSV